MSAPVSAGRFGEAPSFWCRTEVSRSDTRMKERQGWRNTEAEERRAREEYLVRYVAARFRNCCRASLGYSRRVQSLGPGCPVNSNVLNTDRLLDTEEQKAEVRYN